MFSQLSLVHTVDAPTALYVMGMSGEISPQTLSARHRSGSQVEPGAGGFSGSS